MTYKAPIYRLIKHAPTVVSGEKISDQLGVSRVTVWKYVKAMIAEGIPIIASPSGYRLDPEEDSLHPLAFGEQLPHVHYFAETESTMNHAEELARHGCPSFSVVVAEHQTQGRGRMSRTWVSAQGGLYLTMIVRPEIAVHQASLANLAAAVALNDTLRDDYGIASALKWPNDILVGDRKISGFLSRMVSEGELVTHLCIGIGLNVNNLPGESEPNAISMKQITGRNTGRRALLLRFIKRYQQLCEPFEPEQIRRRWLANNTTIGKDVSVMTIRHTFRGRAIALDEHGGLLLEGEDGSTETVVHGDCFYH